MYQKTRRRPESAKHWTILILSYINLVWLIVTLVIHRSGGVRQRAFVAWHPDNRGVHKEKLYETLSTKPYLQSV